MHTYPRFQASCWIVAKWQVYGHSVYYVHYLSTKGGDWVLFGETYLFCVCVWHAVHPSKDIFVPGLHSVQRSDIWQMDFSGIESLKTHHTHFKLAYIDLALNHFEPSWLWIHTRKKHKSTPKEHQNSLRKFAIWGSQFSELWPWWMILRQSQIHFFIFYQSELSQVFHWLGPHPFKVQSLWVLAAIMSLDLEINMRSECTSWRPWNHCAILRPYEGICCVRR